MIGIYGNNSFYMQVEKTVCLFSLFYLGFTGKKIDSFVILKVNYGKHNKAINSKEGCERDATL